MTRQQAKAEAIRRWGAKATVRTERSPKRFAVGVLIERGGGRITGGNGQIFVECGFSYEGFEGAFRDVDGKETVMTKQEINALDAATKFRLAVDLKREFHAEGCTDERALELIAEIRKLEAKPKAKRTPKAPKERYMDVLGHYVLDMENHGRLVGTRDGNGNVIGRDGRKVGKR